MPLESQAIPPKISRPLSPGIFVGVVLTASAMGLAAVLFFFNPGTHAFYPVCWFHQLTGLNCPGCGATRAAYSILHGHLLLALKDNALFVLALAFFTPKIVLFTVHKSKDRAAAFNLSPKLLWGFLFIAVVFTVIRNLPAFSFLSP
jgi:hypothetical protein